MGLHAAFWGLVVVWKGLAGRCCRSSCFVGWDGDGATALWEGVGGWGYCTGLGLMVGLASGWVRK